MGLKKYLLLVKRWAWLLIIGLVVGAAGSLLVSMRMKPVYQATTTVLTTRAGQGSSSSNTDATYSSDQTLTQTYVRLASSDSLKQAVAEQLNYPIRSGQITAEQVLATQIIQITVQDTNPAHAAQIANTFVQVLIAKNDELQSGRYNTMEQSLDAQKTQMQTQIADLQTQIDQASTLTVNQQKQWIEGQISTLQTEISQLQGEIAVAGIPVTLAETDSLSQKKSNLAQIQSLLTSYQQAYNNLMVNGQPMKISTGDSGSSTLSLLQTTQNLYQQIYLSILSNLEQVRLARLQDTPNVVQIEPALAPTNPIKPRPLQNTILGGIAGLMVAAGGVFLIDYLDDTLKTPEDAERITGLSVIGFIAEMQSDNGKGENLYVTKEPRSPISEAFRSLRTNLEFSGVDKPIKTIIVTSPGPGEGKTTVAANLAAIISHGGKRVLLLDTDLRRPSVHKVMRMPNKVGLSNVFRGNLRLQEVMQVVENSDGFNVITSGSLPPNPTELLGSAKMLQILDELEKLEDVVIIDCPPALVPDAQVLAAKVDGVLVVIQPGHTHIDSTRATIKQLKRAEANLIGVVFNRIPRDRSGYYGDHYALYSTNEKGYNYYPDEDRKGQKKK